MRYFGKSWKTFFFRKKSNFKFQNRGYFGKNVPQNSWNFGHMNHNGMNRFVPSKNSKIKIINDFSFWAFLGPFFGFDGSTGSWRHEPVRAVTSLILNEKNNYLFFPKCFEYPNPYNMLESQLFKSKKSRTTVLSYNLPKWLKSITLS